MMSNLTGRWHWLRGECELFFIALSFYSRLPVPNWVQFESDKLHRCGRYFPLVGWCLALLFIATYALLSQLLIPQLALGLAMVVQIWLTGAFHEDGFADFCDGFGGGYDKAQILNIMKDSRLGSYGGIGIMMMLLLRFWALGQFQALLTLSVVVWLGFALSRFLAYSYLYDMSYVREDPNAKAAMMVVKTSRSELLTAGLFGLLPLLLFPWGQALTLLGLLLLIRFIFKRYLLRHIGGYTGDCLGAAQQIFELTIYLVMGAQCWSSI